MACQLLVIIGSDNGLSAIRCQAITWAIGYHGQEAMCGIRIVANIKPQKWLDEKKNPHNSGDFELCIPYLIVAWWHHMESGSFGHLWFR